MVSGRRTLVLRNRASAVELQPPNTTREVEEYPVELSDVTLLELIVMPNNSRGAARASLKSLRLSCPTRLVLLGNVPTNVTDGSTIERAPAGRRLRLEPGISARRSGAAEWPPACTPHPFPPPPSFYTTR